MATANDDTPQPSAAPSQQDTIHRLRDLLNRADHCAQHLATHAPDPARHGFDGVVILVGNALRILGEISEAELIERAQRDLDTLRSAAARRERGES